MKLEEQVCSLELSKRLKELGVKQEGYFQWCDTWGTRLEWLKNTTPYVAPCDNKLGKPLSSDRAEQGRIDDNLYSAFTVAELIELLGEKFGVLERFKDGGFGAYIPNDIGVSATGKKVADVLAELLEKTREESKV